MNKELKPCTQCGNTRASGWISVSEGLPKDGEMIIFKDNEGTGIVEYGSQEDMNYIIKWMPLPK